jgi:hypothetical protein
LDVSTDEYYQRRYNSFYVVRRNRRWCGHFYDLLQRKKCEAKVTFAEVIRDLYRLTKRVEPSFSSKLVAIIRPDLPTYDVMVCRHMNVSVPPPSIRAEQRIDRLIIEYDRMISITASAVKTREFEALAKRFDQQFPVHETFTNSKKLDLMLWQCRNNNRSEANA